MGITDISITNPVLRKTPWKQGPAASAASPVLVSLTDFHIDGYRDLLRVVRTALGIQSRWGGREGSLGLSLWVHPLKKRLGSLSAWESEEDYLGWVRSAEHMRVVSSHRSHMQNISSDTWWTDCFKVKGAWREVGRRWAHSAEDLSPSA